MLALVPVRAPRGALAHGPGLEEHVRLVRQRKRERHTQERGAGVRAGPVASLHLWRRLVPRPMARERGRRCTARELRLRPSPASREERPVRRHVARPLPGPDPRKARGRRRRRMGFPRRSAHASPPRGCAVRRGRLVARRFDRRRNLAAVGGVADRPVRTRRVHPGVTRAPRVHARRGEQGTEGYAARDGPSAGAGVSVGVRC